MPLVGLGSGQLATQCIHRRSVEGAYDKVQDTVPAGYAATPALRGEVEAGRVHVGRGKPGEALDLQGLKLAVQVCVGVLQVIDVPTGPAQLVQSEQQPG